MVSIITAAFTAKYMDRVWESIKKQTHKDWEWIIVNDGQQEIRDWYKKRKKEDLFEGCDKNIWMVDIEKNRGHFGLYARNVGASVVKNNHFVFLDDDNEWYEDHLESLIKLKKKTGKHPYCWLHIKGKKPGSTYDRIKETDFNRQGIDLGCLLWEKKFFEKYGGFRADSQVTFDFNQMARIYFDVGPHEWVSTKKPTLIFWHKRY